MAGAGCEFESHNEFSLTGWWNGHDNKTESMLWQVWKGDTLIVEFDAEKKILFVADSHTLNQSNIAMDTI